jgi:tetratricopeptide (TPR) repeat protein
MASTPILVSSILNNEASVLLKSGRFDEAIALLTRSLREMSGRREAKRPLRKGVPTSEIVFARHLSTTDLSGEKHQALHTKLSNEFKTPLPQQPYIYQEPILIANTINSEDPDYCTVATLSFIMLFNIALAYHLSGIKNDKDTYTARRKFEVAKKLYGLAFAMQEREEEMDSLNSLGVDHHLLVMALVNNLSVVMKALNQEHEAMTKCDQCLLSSVLSIVDMGGVVPAMSDILNGFIGNVMYLIIKKSHLASAA